jgi:hypothetical protein
MNPSTSESAAKNPNSCPYGGIGRDETIGADANQRLIVLFKSSYVDLPCLARPGCPGQPDIGPGRPERSFKLSERIPSHNGRNGNLRHQGHEEPKQIERHWDWTSGLKAFSPKMIASGGSMVTTTVARQVRFTLTATPIFRMGNWRFGMGRWMVCFAYWLIGSPHANAASMVTIHYAAGVASAQDQSFPPVIRLLFTPSALQCC